MPEPCIAHELKTCPRCGRTFACKHSDPVQCDCARAVLPAVTRSTIRRHYSDCLCLACLSACAAGADVAGTPGDKDSCDRQAGP